MTDPSQYFKGRTVQEQMNEVIGYVDVRSAEVATDAIAADVAQVHSDAADAHADALAAAASAAAAAGTLANAVKKSGEASQNVEGDLNLTTGGLAVSGDAAVQGNFSVVGDCEVRTPVNNNDAANKKYVDDADALKISISDINSYAVGLTGNQNPIAGKKTFTSGIDIKVTSLDRTTSPVTRSHRDAITVTDGSNRELAALTFVYLTNGDRAFNLTLWDKNGTRKEKTVFQIDENGNVIQ